MRLIDADALIEAHYDYCNTHHGEADVFYSWSQNLIKDAPTIEAEPARHGWWYKPQEWQTKAYKRLCSNCQDVAYYIGTGDYRYCPNCGAKMDGGERGRV